MLSLNAKVQLAASGTQDGRRRVVGTALFFCGAHAVNAFNCDTSAKSAEGKGQFDSEFHELSHSIRNRLNAINGFAELLLMDKSLSPANADYVRAILAGTETLTAALVAHLDLAEEHGRSIETRPVPNRSIVKQARRATATRKFHRSPTL